MSKVLCLCNGFVCLFVWVFLAVSLAFKDGSSVVKTSQLSLPFVLAVTCISRKVSEPAANKEEMDGKS